MRNWFNQGRGKWRWEARDRLRRSFADEVRLQASLMHTNPKVRREFYEFIHVNGNFLCDTPADKRNVYRTFMDYRRSCSVTNLLLRRVI